MELVRLVYSSESTSLVDWPLLKDIFATAEENNASKDVSGILLNSGMVFLQVLEGDKAVVRDLYNEISQDPRHHDCQIHALERIDDRSFGSWKMRGFNIDKLDPEDQESIKARFCDDTGNLFIDRSKDSTLALIEAVEKVKLH